ncbi:MAG: tyrosine-type recombinase/integrase [Candidatus Methanomethyliaceae archaeon]
MARGSKIKKIVGKRGVSYRITVDVGTDPGTGKRKQKVLTAKTKQELETLVAQTLADVSRNVYVEPVKMTMAQYLDYWLKNYAKTNTEITTYQKYESIMSKHVIPAIGAIPVTKLAPLHVQQYLTAKADEGLCGKTLACHYTILNEALNHAVKWEIIPRNVCMSVTKPKAEWKEVEVLTPEQLKQIMDSLDGIFNHVSHILFHTAARIGEVLALKKEDLHLNEGHIMINRTLKPLKGGIIGEGVPKGKKRRRIDIEAPTVKVFKARLKEIAREKLAIGEGYSDSGYLFAKPDGTPYFPATFAKYWGNKVWAKTGIRTHPHVLRHTSATMMLMAGIPLKTVSEMLGHSSIAITADVYGHVTPTSRRQAAKALVDCLK